MCFFLYQTHVPFSTMPIKLFSSSLKIFHLGPISQIDRQERRGGNPGDNFDILRPKIFRGPGFLKMSRTMLTIN